MDSSYFKDYYERNKVQIDKHNIGYYRTHKAQYKQSAKAYYRKLKDEAFRQYGSKCKCCKEKTKLFLTFDHINNDGNRHKRKLKSRSTIAVLLDLRKRKWPKIVNVSCFNCNCGRALNNGVCPHNV